MRQRTAIHVCSQSAGTKGDTFKVTVTDNVRAQHHDNLTAAQRDDLVANPRFTGAWGEKATLHGDTAQQSMDKLDALLASSTPEKVVVKKATRKPRKAAA